VLPLLGCGVAAAVLIIASRKSRVAAMASLWLALPLLPPLAAIGLFSHVDLAHDRYLYVPSIGFVILVALLLRRIPSKGVARTPSSAFANRGDDDGVLRTLPASSNQIIPALILAAVFAVLTVMQSIPWANNLLLYYRGVQTAPHSALARSHLGTEMMARGDLFDALRLYREARDLSPDDWAANFVLGFACFQAGRYVEAEQPLRDAIRIAPRNGNQYLYLGLALMNLGRLDEAEASVRQGIAASPPNIPGFHYGLGLVLQKKGQLAAARDEFNAELNIDPTSGARANLAEVDRQLAGQAR
jgi:Flp pilus assembly protein TadD